MCVMLVSPCLNRVTIRCFLCLLFMLLLHPNAIAEQTPGYRIELLIVQNIGNQPHREEAPNPALLAEAFLKSDRSRQGIQISSSSEVFGERLGPIHQKLIASADYQVLFSGYWNLRQSKGNSKPAWIDLETDNGRHFLTGRFRLVTGHLLFVDVQIVFPDPSVVSSSAKMLPPYLLNEIRRIRLDEIHYFDHPKLGVLLTVRRHPVRE